ncbi:MAG: flagellar hook-length control protein FliK [Oscillospiraceae bacterium]|nr:flagellar hook-length control protein FliK [Oscillospiraceae bacterium]
MNTVLFDLQAAVMAASVSSGNSSLTEIPEDGNSFSDVLAAQKELVTEGAVNQAAENGEVDAAMPEEEAEQDFSAVLEAIENADENMKKAMLKLLQTVLKAFRGADDDKERATDLFALFSDGSAGMAEDEEEDMLLSCELLNQTGMMIEAELTEGKAAEEIIAELEDTIVKILGEDADETTAAELMASLLGAPTGIADGNDLMSAADVLKSAKQAICEINPEDAEKMEQLFADIKGISYNKTEEVPELFRLNFTTVKINNVSEQVAAIGNDEEINPELMTDVKPEIIADKPVITEKTAESVQIQVTEVVTEKLSSMKSDNGTEELTMILKPENLGEVAVKIVKENGAVTVLLSAQYDEVGKTLTDRAALLSSSLQNQNYNVKEVLVVAAGNAAEQMGLDFTNQGFGFSRESNREQNSSGRAVSGIDAIDETEAVEETATIKEAKLWTTA